MVKLLVTLSNGVESASFEMQGVTTGKARRDAYTVARRDYRGFEVTDMRKLDN